jgi:hypothetical protein
MKKDRFLSDRYLNGQIARYYYRKGEVLLCIKNLLASEFTYKNLGMMLTVSIPRLRNWVLNNFRVDNFEPQK